MFCFNFFWGGGECFVLGFFVSFFVCLVFFFLYFFFFFAHLFFFFLNVTELFFINRLIGCCCCLAYKNLILFLVISFIRRCNRKRFGDSAVSDNYKCLNNKYTMLLRTLTLIFLSTFAQFLKFYNFTNCFMSLFVTSY